MRYLRKKRRRDLLRKKWQYLAVVVTIFLGVFLFISGYDAYQNLNNSYQGTYSRLAFADMLVTGADPGFADDVTDIDGVATAEDRLQAEMPVRIDGHVLVGRFVGMPEDKQPDVNKIDIEDGEYLSAEDPDGVLVETHMADHFGLEVGDTIEMFDGTEWTDITVRGIAISPEYLWPAASRQNLFPSPDQFGVMFAREGMVEDLPAFAVVRQTMVLYDEDVDVETVDDAVASAARKANASDSQPQAEQPSDQALGMDVQGFEQMAYMFAALFLLAAGMASYMILTRLIYTERAQIGTLMANGLSRGEVLRHYLMYGIELALIGAFFGILLGVPAGWGMAGLYTSELGIPDTTCSLYPMTPVIGLLFALVAGVLSAWVPARAAFKLSPAEAMRGDVPEGSGHVNLTEKMLPFLRHAPVRWRMAIRGIGRNRKRSLSTVTAIVLALILVLVSWGMLDTVDYLINRQFNEISLEDAVAVMTMPVTDDSLATIEDVEGVDSAEKVIALGVTVKGTSDSYATQLQGFDADTKMHTFEGFDGTPSGGVVLGEAIGSIMDVEKGDTVVVDFPSLDTEIEAEVLGFVSEPLGTFVYAEQDWLIDALGSADPPVTEAELDSPATSIVMTTFDEGVDREKVIERMEDLDGVAAVSDSRLIYDIVQQYMGLFYLIVGLMLVFGGILAFALIFNMMSVNLAERAGENATMLANGMPARSIASLIVGENMLLTAIGIVPGLIIGYWASAVFMASFSNDMFSFDLYMRPMTFVYSSIAVFVVTLIALVPGIRAVRRIDLGKVVRERSQ